MRLNINVDDDFFAVLICALRYCCGRRTYMPGLVTDWVMKNMHGKIPERDLHIMLRDIEDQRRYGEMAGSSSPLGDPCDVETWKRFELWLTNELENVNKEES